MTPLTIWQNVVRLSPLEMPTQRRALRIRDAIGNVVATIDTSHTWGGSKSAHALRSTLGEPHLYILLVEDTPVHSKGLEQDLES